MNKIVNYKNLLLAIAIPQILFLVSFFSQVNENNDKLTILIVILTAINIAFTIFSTINKNKETIDKRVLIAISAVYSVFIAIGLSFFGSTLLFEQRISPRLVFILACVIPVLFSVYGIVEATMSPEKDHNIAKYIGGLLVVPMVSFFALNIFNGANSNTLMMILIVASGYAILLFLTKLFFAWKLKKKKEQENLTPKKKNYILIAIIALAMPLAGLILNQTFASFHSGNGKSIGLFGDFSNPLFYIIAAINGTLLLIPPQSDKRLQLMLFYLKAVGYTYILYFFAVFVPLMPLGALGIAFYGLGILIFAPTMVTILQGVHIYNEWNELSKSNKKRVLILLFISGIVTLPLSVTAVFYGDKGNFETAVKYLEQNNVNFNQPVDLGRLQRTIDNINSGLDSNRNMDFSSGNIPIISDFYTNYILGGKVVSPENIQRLENLFFDAGHNINELNLTNRNNNAVRLSDATTETKYDEKNECYKTWVNLKLQNSAMSNVEYVTKFNLPEGAYISDYYLNVAGAKKEGILTDRRAALFIYRKIVNTRRDPGLLHYIGKNTLELRVFPFNINETRETGFEIIHSKKFNLDIDGKTIPIDGNEQQKEITVNNATLLTAEQKAKLTPITREPSYYFVIDSSKNSDIKWLTTQVKDYTKAKNISNANVIFASYKLEQHSLSDMKQVQLKAECGYNLNMAVKSILSNQKSDKFPIIIAVTNNMPSAIFPQDVYALANKFPESPYYYALNDNFTLTPYSYENNNKGGSIDAPIVESVLKYNDSCAKNDKKNELILDDTTKGEMIVGAIFKTEFTSSGNQYKDAIQLISAYRRGQYTNSADFLDLLRSSFRSRILTPQNAFIVVETEQQEKELMNLQENLLNNNQELRTVSLDEPPFELCILLLVLLLWAFNWIRKNRYNSKLILTKT